MVRLRRLTRPLSSSVIHTGHSGRVAPSTAVTRGATWSGLAPTARPNRPNPHPFVPLRAGSRTLVALHLYVPHDADVLVAFQRACPIRELDAVLRALPVPSVSPAASASPRIRGRARQLTGHPPSHPSPVAVLNFQRLTAATHRLSSTLGYAAALRHINLLIRWAALLAHSNSREIGVR